MSRLGRCVLVALLLSTPALLVESAARLGLRYNHSGSLPEGLYREVPGTVHAGDLAAACLPATAAEIGRGRGYVGRGFCPGGVEPVLKVVVAVAGDRVELSPDGVSVDGTALPLTAPRHRDRHGRGLVAYPFGSYQVPAGAVWLYAPHPASWDSRYWGPVDASAIIGPVRPLWTARP